MSLDFNDYQEKAFATAIYPEAGTGSFSAVSYAVLGLVNEAGEVSGKLKKVWRDNDGELTPELRKKIADELGDVLWYAAALADELGTDLSTVAKENMYKLLSRQARGVIGGSGDNR